MHIYWIDDKLFKSEKMLETNIRNKLNPRKNDLPNLIYTYNNYKDHYWIKNGKLHRFTGPSYIHYKNNKNIGYCEWYIKGEFISNDWFEKHDIDMLNPNKSEVLFIQYILDYKIPLAWFVDNNINPKNVSDSEQLYIKMIWC